MRLGIAPGPRGNTLSEVVDAVAAHGVKHVSVSSRLLAELTPDQVRAECRRAGVSIDGIRGEGPNPSIKDPVEFERRLATFEETLKLARSVGCPVIVGSAGHPGFSLRLGTRAPGLLEEIIACWQRVAPLLDRYRIYLAMESGIHTTLYKPEQFTELFQRVGCEYLTTTMDVVNMLSAEDYYDQHPKIDALFDRCRGHVHSAHLKDIVHEERLHTHLNEAVAGEGFLDWEYLLPHIDRALPDWGVAFIEHTPWEKMPTAVDFVKARAAACGVAVE